MGKVTGFMEFDRLEEGYRTGGRTAAEELDREFVLDAG